MKWTLQFVLITAIATAADASADDATAADAAATASIIAVELYELDCSKCEEMARGLLVTGQIRDFHSDDPAFIQLKEAATERSILKYSQELNIKGRSTYQTEIDEIKFRFDVNVVKTDVDGCMLELDLKLSKPAEKKVSGGIGKIFSASQQQGREVVSITNRVEVSKSRGRVIASPVNSTSGVPLVRVLVVTIQDRAERQ
jgi:hypothetical protein